MSNNWDRAVWLQPDTEPILAVPDHIKALPEQDQGPALVEEMLALIGKRPGDYEVPKRFA